ncbi:Hypothetical protein BN69_2067 [Methylocystis sp. SC2]|nr:Hypothetical protein BN69_2067 [Methylocystis sp. SC2]
MTAMVRDTHASAMTRVMAARMIMMVAAGMAAVKPETKPSEHRANETQLRGCRLRLQNDKRQRESAEQQSSARKPTVDAVVIVSHGIRPRRR